MIHLNLPDEGATQTFGAALADAAMNDMSSENLVIHLHGDLGAGKTTLARAFVQHCLPDVRVKSPTYTLLESYDTARGPILHLDLYRIADPEELDYLALGDLMSDAFATIIEWPEKGGDATPSADLDVSLAVAGPGRRVYLASISPRGDSVLASVVAAFGLSAG